MKEEDLQKLVAEAVEKGNTENSLNTEKGKEQQSTYGGRTVISENWNSFKHKRSRRGLEHVSGRE